MAVTEAPAPADTHAPDAATGTGPAALLGSVDHVAVGRLFVVASVLFLVVSRVADALIGAERLDVGEVTILDDFASRIDLLHHLGVPFLLLLVAATLLVRTRRFVPDSARESRGWCQSKG